MENPENKKPDLVIKTNKGNIISFYTTYPENNPADAIVQITDALRYIGVFNNITNFTS